MGSQSDFGAFQANLAVFQQPWWLEIARGDEDYRELQVRRNGMIVGNLAFIVVTNKLGNKLAFPPIWSHLGGPVVSQALDRDERAGVIRQLIARLPGKVSFKFVCNPNTADADLIRQAFEEEGFEHRAETTYLQRPEGPDILSRISSKHKGHLRRAERDLDVVQIGADEFIEFYRANLRAAGKQCYASLKNARDLIATGQESSAPQVRVFAARRKGAASPLDAAIACAWDSERYYLWMVTRRRLQGFGPGAGRPHGDAVKLLILRATQHAQSLNLIFDVDGAASEGANNLYGEILKFPIVESRDVFVRDTRLQKIYRQFQPKLRELSARLT
jgi:hypothetical protein